MGILSVINSLILAFLFVEFTRAILFTRGWKYRFNEGSIPLSNWKKGLILLVLFLVFFPAVNWVFTNFVPPFLEYLGFYQWSLLLILLPFSYLWIEKRILHSRWSWRDLIPIFVIILTIVASFYL